MSFYGKSSRKYRRDDNFLMKAIGILALALVLCLLTAIYLSIREQILETTAPTQMEQVEEKTK